MLNNLLSGSSSALKYRNELKYLLNEKDIMLLKMRLNELIERDANTEDGKYLIRSLYFDDYNNSAFNDKIAGVNDRKKYRIRIYNYSDSVIKLERKLKQGQYINKQAASITKDEFYKIISGDYGFLLKSESNLLREFYYEVTANFLRPRVIVDYEREPFVYKFGDVRITFDYDVRAAYDSFDIFDKNIATQLTLEPGKQVLEVKFTEYLPDFIRAAITPDSAEYTAVSKYVLCCTKVLYKI